VNVVERRARQLELAAGLEADRPAAGHVVEADDLAGVDDRLPAEQASHAFEQRADPVRPLIGDGRQVGAAEREFFVLGADLEFGRRAAARLHPRDEVVPRRKRGRVGLVAGHAGRVSGGTSRRQLGGRGRAVQRREE